MHAKIYKGVVMARTDLYSSVFVSVRPRGAEQWRVVVATGVQRRGVVSARICVTADLVAVVRSQVLWAREHAIEVYMSDGVLLLLGDGTVAAPVGSSLPGV